MKNLFFKLDEVVKSDVKYKIDNKLEELSNNIKTKRLVFLELLFCIMTANFQAKKSIYIQQKYPDELENADEEKLKIILKKEGHRFWEQRAQRIVLARDKKEELWNKVTNRELDNLKLREWVVENFKGIGMKEASHFLRNIGLLDFAIIDFHIVDLLVKEKIIERPKTITKKRYIEIEKILKEIAEKYKMKLGELDFYLWYIETGNILK